jgi:hypothetical protein|tara:strand:+ start:488 stop:652 length:165 start_codon:yes stop_codon:yes gene_type:complete
VAHDETGKAEDGEAVAREVAVETAGFGARRGRGTATGKRKLRGKDLVVLIVVVE